MDKDDASNFFAIIGRNLQDECYEEGCTFNEVVNYYGQSESSVSLLFPVQAKISFFEEVLEDKNSFILGLKYVCND